MSSSRSIAAARNRRAMEQQQPNLLQRSRPNTSIASQPAFSQPQYAQQMNSKRVQNPNPNNQNNPNNPNFQQNKKPIRNFQSGNTPGSIPVAVNKISVSDAIGLITIRLGRVEQYMQSLDEQGFLSNSSSMDENKIFVNKDFMDNLLERIYSLETTPIQVTNVSENNQIEKLKIVISDLEKEIISLKELVKKQIGKIEILTVETENKFLDIENAFIDLEKKEGKMEETEGNIQLVVKEELGEGNQEEEEEDSDLLIEPTFSKVDLKNIINLELANEIIN